MLQLAWWGVKLRSFVKFSTLFLVKVMLLIQSSCPGSDFNDYMLPTFLISVLVESCYPLSPVLNCSWSCCETLHSRGGDTFTLGNRSICRNNGSFWGLLKSRELYSCKKSQVKTEKLPDFFLFFFALNVWRIVFWLKCEYLLHGQVYSRLHVFVFHRIQVPCMFKICIFWWNGFTSCDVFDETKDNLQW